MKKILFVLIIIFALFLNIANAQSIIEWQKCFGGSNLDIAYSIQQVSDGGYIIAGTTQSSDGDVTGFHGYMDDFWVVKISSIGIIQWQKCLGGTGQDDAYSVQQTSDGGYIVVGYTESNDGDVTGNHGAAFTSDVWIVKLGSSGNIKWQKCLGGSGNDMANSIKQTNDGGYIVAGATNSNDGDVTGNHQYYGYVDSCDCYTWINSIDYWVVKLDSTGLIQWQKCLGGSGDEWAQSIQQTSDGGYIIAGFTMSNDGDVTGNHGNEDYWIVKLNSTGIIEWQKCLGGSGDEWAQSIQQTSDGGYIVAGWSGSNDGDVSGNHGGGDYWIVKLNSAGNIQWQKCLGGSNTEQAFSIQQTSDGGYIVAGYTYSNNGNITGNHNPNGNLSDYWLVKINSAGNLQWQKCLGGTKGEVARSIQLTNDGGYIVAGSTTSNDGDVTGNHDTTGNYADYWIVKLSPDTAASINEIKSENMFNLYPNPSSEVLSIEYKVKSKKNEGQYIVYVAMGQMLLNGSFAKQEFQINISSLAKGLYLLKVEDEEGVAVKRFVKE